MNIYISTGAFKTADILRVLEIASAEGFTQLELSSGLRCSPELLPELRRAVRSGLSVLVHNYFPAPETPFVLNLASEDSRSLRLSREHCRRAVDLCVELGSPFYSVHAGFAFRAEPSQLGHDLTGAPRGSLAAAQRVFVESLRDLCAYAEKSGIRIAIENNVLAPFNLVNGKNLLCLCVTAQEMLDTLAQVGADNLGILLDVAHARVSGNAMGFDSVEFLSKVGPHLLGLHLSDNDGTADQNLPVTKSSWFLPYLAAFKNLPVVLESYKLEPAAIRLCRDAIDEARLGASVQ